MSPAANTALESSKKGTSAIQTDLNLEETENVNPQAPQEPVQVHPGNRVFASTAGVKANALKYSLKGRI